MRWWPPIAFLALAVAIRLPFFFVDVVDWDESTFILMGSAWSDGHLPYVTLWDNKPPLCFAPFALVISVFGKSIVAVRLLGLVCIVGTAVAVWKLGEELLGRDAGVIAGFACVVFATFASRGQATMSETLAIFPLSTAMWFLLVDGQRPGRSAMAGVCLSVSALIRLNLAVVALAALVWLLVRDRRAGAALATGGAIPLVGIALPYAVAGQLSVAFESVFIAPWVYALSGLGLLAVTVPLALPSLFWWLAAATALSIGISGGGSAHYWIQIHPFTALVVGALLGEVLRRSGNAKPWLSGAAALILPVAGALSDANWWGAVQRMGTVHGRSLTLAEYLAPKRLGRGDVLLLADHLAYWWLDVLPPHRMATHPSSMFRSSLVRAAVGSTPERVLEEIFAEEPQYVVREAYVRHLDSAPQARELLERELRQNYRVEHVIGKLKIYVRAP